MGHFNVSLKSTILTNCAVVFHIDVTFKIRTALSGIGLFIGDLKSSDSIFISNGDGEKESWIAERQRERECVCVCEAARSRKGEIASVIK
jgi:hypothetical protein